MLGVFPCSPEAFPGEALQPGVGVGDVWGCLGSSRTQFLTMPLLLEGLAALAGKPWVSLAALHHFDLDFDTMSLSPVLTEWERKLCVFEQITAL